ncbi:MAG: bifunctional transaldolase/phosoglucose isomerase, partial [Thermoplasmata archaeon]
LEDSADLGQEFFRWEVAVAAAGAVLEVDPFDQPDVELAKELARSAMSGRSGGGEGEAARVPELVRASSDSLPEAVRRWTSAAAPGGYVALQAYLEPSEKHDVALARVREGLRDRLGLPTTLGYGPSFLHSTGQLHKGGPSGGLYLQIVDDPTEKVAIPGTEHTFAQVIRAQATGDASALVSKGRWLLRVDVGEDAIAGLAELEAAICGP